MAVNSYKDDEMSVERSKVQTLLRLFHYLLAYKWQIVLVLLIMGYQRAVQTARGGVGNQSSACGHGEAAYVHYGEGV